MRRFLALAILAAFAAAGCMKMEQEVTLKADGSADVHLVFGMKKEMFGGDPAKEAEFSEESFRKKFEEEDKEGVELKSVKVEEKEGWKYADIEMACKDLSTAVTATAGDAGPKAKAFSLTKNDEGNYVLEIKDENAGKMGGGDMPPEQKKKMQEMMKARMAGLRIAITYKLPGDVLETNAHTKGKREVSWVFDADKDPDFFEKLEAAGKEPIRVVFEGKGLDLKEIKPDDDAAKEAKEAEEAKKALDGAL